jgi:hypothetical protein
VKYTPDGGVIPSGIPIGDRGSREHRSMFGLYRGVVLNVLYPEDPQNSSGDRIEYVVRVRGQIYPNAINATDAGGIYNYREKVRKSAEKSFSGKLESGTYDENIDGEHVYVMFLEGHGNVPIIVGASEHPKKATYKKKKRADGRFDVNEFNGIEFLIDKDSNYTIKHVGRKDPSGKILNQAAVDSQIKMSKEGDIEFNTHGTSGTADLRIKLTKASKKIEIYAQDNKIVIDAAGFQLTDKNNNKVTTSSTGMVLEDLNGNKTTKDAAGILFEDANGNKVTMSAAGIEMEDSNGNKITMAASGININSSANLVKIDGSVYGLHQHIGNLGIPTPPPLDANTE